MALWGGRHSIPSGIFGALWFGFATLLAAIFSLEIYASYLTMRDAVASGRDMIAEGPIESLRVTGIHNHRSTEFVVGGVSFSSQENQLGSGFRDTPGDGSPLRSGLRARIHYVPIPHGGRHIVRLEIAKEHAASVPVSLDGGAQDRSSPLDADASTLRVRVRDVE